MQILGRSYPKRTTIIGERLELMAGTHEGRVIVFPQLTEVLTPFETKPQAKKLLDADGGSITLMAVSYTHLHARIAVRRLPRCRSPEGDGAYLPAPGEAGSCIVKESWVVVLSKLMVLILAVPLKVPHAIGCGKK